MLFATAAFSQTEPGREKSESAMQKAKEKVAQTGSRDRLVVDFTYDNWYRKNLPAGVSTKSFGFGFNFYFFYDILLGKSRFSVAPGIGFGVSNVELTQQLLKKNDTTLVANFPTLSDDQKNSFRTKTNFSPFLDAQHIKHYRLNTLFLDIPVELRYRTKPNKRNKSVKVAIGFKGGVLIENHTTSKETGVDGNKEIVKTSHYSDLSTFRYGPTFRIGYGPFSIISYYGLGELFGSNGPQSIHPFSVGISINGL
jgi:hypothetical protein